VITVLPHQDSALGGPGVMRGRKLERKCACTQIALK
jgi:hypothetical protein